MGVQEVIQSSLNNQSQMYQLSLHGNAYHHHLCMNWNAVTVEICCVRGMQVLGVPIFHSNDLHR